jgi:lipoprotein-anchoring transpeptidase ErfK/SrfK
MARESLKGLSTMMKLSQFASFLGLAAGLFTTSAAQAETAVIVSVRDQAMAVIRDGVRVKTYPVSTSKFGLGDRPSSYGTPLGSMRIAQKIGAGLKPGAVLKHRQATGEVLRPNTPGRDPIVSRILWLRGLESQNARAFARKIYIHGTADERHIGSPASYGCIRMKSRDVIRVFEQLPVGTKVEVVKTSISTAIRETASAGERGRNGAS